MIESKNKLVITITDISGSKQYNLHQLMKRFLFYFMLLIISLILFSIIAIKMLMTEVKSIQNKKDAISREYEASINTNNILNEEIKERQEELMIIGSRLENIEGIVGVKKADNNEIDIKNRVDVATITGIQKAIVMSVLPNGHPMRAGSFTDTYGSRIHPVLDRFQSHAGVDIGTAIGTPVYATADAVVEFARKEYNGGYGNIIKLTHSFGFMTYYAHLSDIKVKIGDFVKKGDLIGYSGNTGLTTGPHLHYEVRFLGLPVNPMNFINWTMKDYTLIFIKERSIQWQSLLMTINKISEIKAPLSSQAEQQ